MNEQRNGQICDKAIIVSFAILRHLSSLKSHYTKSCNKNHSPYGENEVKIIACQNFVSNTQIKKEPNLKKFQ